MTDTPQEPLWRVMDRAAYPKPQPRGHSYRAAEIRAVADWLDRMGDGKPWLGIASATDFLRVEANRAERGDA
jgi:hypothetical protein